MRVVRLTDAQWPAALVEFIIYDHHRRRRRRQVPSPVRGLEAMQRHLSQFWAARLHAAKLIPVQSITL